MERNSSLTLRQILTRLSEILALKQTGTFFIATDMNTSCRFAIESGKLTYCTHHREQGMDAIQSLLAIGGGSCSFSENQSIPFRPSAIVDHLPSLEILDIHPQPPAPAPTARPEPTVMEAKPETAPNIRYYRGQPIVTPTTTTAHVEEEPRLAQPPATSGKKRFYRGGVIED